MTETIFDRAWQVMTKKNQGQRRNVITATMQWHNLIAQDIKESMQPIPEPEVANSKMAHFIDRKQKILAIADPNISEKYLHWEGDIFLYDFKQQRKLSLIFYGGPCGSYWIANKRQMTNSVGYHYVDPTSEEGKSLAAEFETIKTNFTL